jgi:hypothetical protein
MFHVTVQNVTILGCSNIIWPNERSNVLCKSISGGYISRCHKKSACLDNYLDKNCFGACICKLPWGLLEKIHTIAAAESMGISVGTPLSISSFVQEGSSSKSKSDNGFLPFVKLGSHTRYFGKKNY